MVLAIHVLEKVSFLKAARLRCKWEINKFAFGLSRRTCKSHDKRLRRLVRHAIQADTVPFANPVKRPHSITVRIAASNSDSVYGLRNMGASRLGKPRSAIELAGKPEL